MSVAPKDQAAELRLLMASQGSAACLRRPAVRDRRHVDGNERPRHPAIVGHPGESALLDAPRGMTGTDLPRSQTARVVAIASGKGGVGKTNIAVNLAISLARRSHRVVLVDADLGTANVDVVMNVKSPFNLSHVLRRERTINEVVVPIEQGLQLIVGASGLASVADLSPFERQALIEELGRLESGADFILLDCGAGISQNVLAFTQSADELLMVTTPEPTALTDAYALIKVLSRAPRTPPISLIVNQTTSVHEGRLVAERIGSVAARFLGLSLNSAGPVLRDPHVATAVQQRVPFVLRYPRSPASTCIAALAMRLDEDPAGAVARPGFFRRVFRFF